MDRHSRNAAAPRTAASLAGARDVRAAILKCVEAYFGRLGGDVFGREGGTPQPKERDATR